jgi:hypothetical protein
MTPVVKAKLDSILRYSFFNAAGQSLPSNVSKVENWLQASRTSGFQKWKNGKLHATNAIKAAIEGQYPKAGMWERMQEWNPLVDELRPPIIDPFVETLLQKIPLKGKEIENIRYALRSDLLLICLEAHYRDIAEPRFFIPYLDPWYAAGHFPCGWDGDEIPRQWDGVVRGGRLIVY